MKYYVALIFTLFTFNSLASDNPELNNPRYYEIKRLYIWDEGVVQAWLSDGADHGCGGSWPNRFQMRMDDVAYNAKFSLLLASKTSNTPVLLSYKCNGTTALITKIRT